MPDETTDATADLLEALLLQATLTLRKGDGIGAILLMEEALTTAERLPQDHSKNRDRYRGRTKIQSR